VIDDRHDRRLALAASGALATFNAADVLSAADVHVATRLADIVGEASEDVRLAVALAVRAVRQGSVCLDLAEASQIPLDEDVVLEWPEPDGWVDAVAASPLISEEILRLEGSRLYLDRYWREERAVCDDVLARLDHPAPELDADALAAGLDRLFGEPSFSEQRDVAERAVRRWTTVLTGGPGTGKTTTVARLLALVAEQHELAHGLPPRIALCAPTAKAAARLQDATVEAADQLPAEDRARLGELRASTLHRLLGWRGSSVRFRHDARHRLPHDVVVVDETSMVSLTHMARLLEAVRADARLVLVGDADQLASVEAGAVLADLVDGLEHHPAEPVERLVTSHRFGEEIGTLAELVRTGDADGAVALLHQGGGTIELVDPENQAAIEALRVRLRDAGLALRRAGETFDAAAAIATLDDHRLLCAHREGRFGVQGWNREVERMVSDATGVTHYETWYPGRPVLVTANDRELDVYNGDVGVTLRRLDGALVVALARGPHEPRLLAPTRLPDADTMHAMTVHKSQGSQAREVTVIMPPPDSRLLTRELFYTAITRAQDRVRIVGTEQAVRDAIGRQVQRASGLADRLRGSATDGG
jgi:exodeoxyribonuclease V alpha subunit